jgi:hypothetical protein
MHDAPATGIRKSYPLWNDVVASEFFPPGASTGGNYVLTLEKSVTHAREVRPVEEEPTHALLLIAAAWSFSGGTYMMIEPRVTISRVPGIKGNADEVERKLLASYGVSTRSSDASMLIDHIGSYSCPPLAYALAIASRMRSEYVTGQLVKYYHEARLKQPNLDEVSWFVNLCKVRDLLQKFYGGGKPARMALSISYKEWQNFGDLLNNHNFRHAELTGNAPPVSPVAIDDAYATARRWVVAYLKTKRLTTF